MSKPIDTLNEAKIRKYKAIINLVMQITWVVFMIYCTLSSAYSYITTQKELKLKTNAITEYLQCKQTNFDEECLHILEGARK